MQTVIFIAGCALGAAVVWILESRVLQNLRAQQAAKDVQLAERVREIANLQQRIDLRESELKDEQRSARVIGEELAGVRAALQASEEKNQLLTDAEGRLGKAFAALSRDALKENSGEFLKLAKTSFATEQTEAKGELNSKHEAFMQVIKPVEKTMLDLEKSVERLSQDKDRLATEAKNLSTALRRADIRGRWGELELQRAAELAGMLNRCDFSLQQTFRTEEERRKRPDMVVNLPHDRYVVVDSKAVMDAYINACECQDPAIVAEHLARHAKLVRDKIDELAKVDYATVLEKKGKNVADMVVCFIPGESFFAAAVYQDPLLLEHASNKSVFLASPTILITLLRAIALGWRDHERSANADEVSRLGKELYSRLGTMKSHFDFLGKSIDNSVEHYNKMVSSLNTRVFPQARKFRELKSADSGAKEIEDGSIIERSIQDTEGADWQQMSIAANSEEPEANLA